MTRSLHVGNGGPRPTIKKHIGSVLSNMNRPADQSPFSPHLAFVVQLREHADVDHGQWSGRVEHVTSGRASHFQSIEELLGFMKRVVTSSAAKSSE